MTFDEMKDRITILTPKQQTGSVINLDDNSKWDDYSTVWAKVEYLKGVEMWSAKAVNSETSIRFIIRYRKDITNDMAIRFGNRVLNTISAVPLDNSKRWLVIVANEVITVGS